MGVSASGTQGTIRATDDITAFYSSSDKRLKRNIKLLENPIEKLKKLNGYTFHWNDKAKGINNNLDLNKREIGVIAQEIEEVLPEIIKDDVSGDYKAVRYEKITPLLIECIKRQEEKLENLQNQINELKNKII